MRRLSSAWLDNATPQISADREARLGLPFYDFLGSLTIVSDESGGTMTKLSAPAVRALYAGLRPSLYGKRYAMALQTYIDESEDPEWFVLAGYIASVDQWIAFSKQWEELLPLAKLSPKGERRFKMSEMATPHFLANVPAFYRVIQNNTRIGAAVTINKKALQRALSRLIIVNDGFELMPKAGAITPYFMAFSWLIRSLQENRESGGFDQYVGHEEKMDFIFDERTEAKEILESWDSFTATSKSELYGARAIFRNDDDFLPLQAADFLAWWVRYWAKIGDKTKSLGWPTKVISMYIDIEPTEEDLFQMLKASAERSIDNAGINAVVYDANTFVSVPFKDA